MTGNNKGAKNDESGSAFMEFCRKYNQICQWICFIGIIVCYSVYAHLQEVLISSMEPKLTVSLILCFQYAIAIVISGVIILMTGGSVS